MQLALAIAWLAGVDGYPFIAANELEERVFFLTSFPPAVVSAGLAGLALTGLGLALVAGRFGRAGRRRVSRWVLGIGAGVLVLVVCDFRLLAAVGYTPLLLVGALPAEASWGSIWPWPIVYQGFAIVGGLIWAALSFSLVPPLLPSSVALARKWGGRAVAVAVVVPLIYAATRYAWALGIPLGISNETMRQGEARGLWVVGAGLATLAVVGALLTLGLNHRWGEVVPRWMPFIGGRRIPPAAVTVPALIVASMVTSAGVMFVRLAFTGLADEFEDALQGSGWAILGPELLWPVWGVALAAAAVLHHLRNHGIPTRRAGPGGPSLPP